MLLMVGGIGFTSVLAATISCFFVKADRREERAEMAEALKRIEADLAYVKARLDPGT